jgi:hypothetical protein
MKMFKAGDVVLGAFATKSGEVLNHYSVVLMSNAGGSLLAYTTSLKSHSQCKQVFTAEDMRLANWSKPCRFDASMVCVVPNSQIRLTGRISKKTLAAIQAGYASALRNRVVSSAMLTESGEVETA